MDYKLLLDNTTKELNDLIEVRRTATNRDERSVQKFFEDYPFSLLAALPNISSQFQIFGSMIISQPRFRSFDGDRSPDFLVVTYDSLNLYFNFIEIEDPSKKIFAANSQALSTDFSQAYNQLFQWSSYGKGEVEDYCKELLATLFHHNFNNTPEKVLHYNFVLLYGFSDEVIDYGVRHNQILQQYFTDPNLHHCTFSRLIRNIRIEYPLYTVKKDASINKFKAIGFVPYKNYTPFEWSELHNVAGKLDLVQNCPYFTGEEKARVISKIETLDNKTYKEILDLTMKDMGTSVFDDLEF